MPVATDDLFGISVSTKGNRVSRDQEAKLVEIENILSRSLLRERAFENHEELQECVDEFRLLAARLKDREITGEERERAISLAVWFRENEYHTGEPLAAMARMVMGEPPPPPPEREPEPTQLQLL